MAAIVDQNTINSTMECRVVLEDIFAKTGDKQSTSAAQSEAIEANQQEAIESGPSASAAHQETIDDPDLIEVVDVETFEENGLKAKRLSPMENVMRKVNEMSK